MLMKTLLDTYRDVTRSFTPGQSVTTIEEALPAANANRWSRERTQARRLRRQRRMDRTVRHSINGWSVRTW